jgi:predicted alpha-1,6-mannanase (GH76 family)
MPVHRGVDDKGSYFQWGKQKKYYYTPGNARSRMLAKRKALLQGGAIMVWGRYY